MHTPSRMGSSLPSPRNAFTTCISVGVSACTPFSFSIATDQTNKHPNPRFFKDIAPALKWETTNIRNSFGAITTLRAACSTAASSMFGLDCKIFM